MEDARTPPQVAIATCIQVAFLVLFYADLFLDWGLPKTSFLAMSFLAWGVALGWQLREKRMKGGDSIGD